MVRKSENYSSQPLQDRLKKALQEQEFIIHILRENHQIDIKPSTKKEDRIRKIDGWLNSEAVQIKLRKTGMRQREDILFEVLRSHRRDRPIGMQILDKQQVGRDYAGKVIHYFVMNQEGTFIHHFSAADIRNSVDEAISEFGATECLQVSSYDANNGTQLRATLDPASKEPKLLAFIPYASIPKRSYSVPESTQSS